jgi:ubiquitin carboxyl-terminal hydrolase 14
MISVSFVFQSKISRLPAYLTVQFVRFYYKEKESINAKILKDVKFPLDFDAFELCSSELQRKLTPMRTRFKVCFRLCQCLPNYFDC